ncbi:MAG: phosphatidate cytidylyltransferase, partial [Betaproteobacteria bacterium]
MAALSVPQQTIGLFAGIGVVLLVASLIGWTLKVTVAKNQSHGVIDNLNTRIKAWWAMVLVIGIAFLFGNAGVTMLFVFISFIALAEFTSITNRGG